MDRTSLLIPLLLLLLLIKIMKTITKTVSSKSWQGHLTYYGNRNWGHCTWKTVMVVLFKVIRQISQTKLVRKTKMSQHHLRERVQSASQVDSWPNLHSSDNCTFLKLCTRTKFTERVFCISGPAAWNALPTEPRQVQCKDTFKRRLKTFYFNLAF